VRACLPSVVACLHDPRGSLVVPVFCSPEGKDQSSAGAVVVEEF
jgi:hypothetical protein